MYKPKYSTMENAEREVKRMTKILEGMFEIREGVFLDLLSGKKFLVMEDEKDNLKLEIDELNEEEIKVMKENDILYFEKCKEEKDEMYVGVSAAIRLHQNYYRNVRVIIFNDIRVTS